MPRAVPRATRAFSSDRSSSHDASLHRLAHDRHHRRDVRRGDRGQLPHGELCDRDVRRHRRRQQLCRQPALQPKAWRGTRAAAVELGGRRRDPARAHRDRHRPCAAGADERCRRDGRRHPSARPPAAAAALLSTRRRGAVRGDATAARGALAPARRRKGSRSRRPLRRRGAGMSGAIAAARAAATETSYFTVDGVHCANCIAKLEKGLPELSGVVSARVNFSSKRVRVEHVANLADEDIQAAIVRLGFAALPFEGEGDAAVPRENRRLLTALAVAGFAAMNVMLLSVSIWSGATGATRTMFHWLSAGIALPAIAYAGRPFFTSAWRALRQGRTNMDVPISIGVTLTAAMSLYETAPGGTPAYFDGAVMLLFFLLAGRYLDSAMRARAADG